MKKMLLIGLTVLVVSLLAVSFAAAQSPEAPVPGANYVDLDGDGYCDNCGTDAATNQHGYGQGAQFAGDALGEAMGPNFIDEDGDGICDHALSEPQMRQHGYGQAAQFAGEGPGEALGPNFVDENGDGICDQLGTGAANQSGRGARGERGGNGGRGNGGTQGAS
jgi:hypothetical protein